MLQQIARQDEAVKCMEINNKLMEAFQSDINQVYKLINHTRGYSAHKEIPYIETLNSKYSGKNILEGFRANRQLLCSENEAKDMSKDTLHSLSDIRLT